METRLSEFKKNIILWYPFKPNCSVLNLENGFTDILENLEVKFDKIVSFTQNENRNGSQLKFVIDKNGENVVEEKFDYVTMIGKYSIDFEEKLEIAKKYVKDDGKILIAVDNQFGLKNWNTTNDLHRGISKHALENLFHKIQFDNFKFYYVFPSYTQANLIYSEDYTLTPEDITRNFAVYKENAIVHFQENVIYDKLLKEGNAYVNQFANAFFIEVSKQSIDTDVKYVTFSNYRKPEYRTMTIIQTEKVIKKAADKKAHAHIEQIAHHLEKLKTLDVDVMEHYENGNLVSNFLKANRFDVELAKADTIESFMQKFSILKNVLEKDLVSYEELQGSILPCIQNYPAEKLAKLHFLKEAFIDFIPKNCFLQNNQLCVFDQEWLQTNIPVEYIYYRAILNTTQALAHFGKEELLQAFAIEDNVDLFENLETYLRDQTVDYEIHDMFFRQYITLEKAERQRNIFREEAFSLQEKVEQLQEENHSLHLELEDARGKLVNYANDLRVISHSSSWKFIQKIRKIIAFFNFKNGISFIDRVFPVGTKRREKYDQKQAIKKEQNRIQDMKNAVDDETVAYWLTLEKIYQKRREELEKAVLMPDSDPYEFWVKANEPTQEELKMQTIEAQTFAIKPKISIVVPLYNTPVEFFRELLFTLYHQTYTNWELCLADGSPEKLTEIENICRKDARIHYHFIGENKGISGNTNEALKLVTGDYIALVDHDDLLPIHGLFEIVKGINEHPEVEFIYTDEDKIEAIDKPRYDPHFKPDYAPDFLMSGNYICHLSVFKKELMDQLKGFKSEYDGAQDFDIILRATEIAGPEHILHIPKILYHWRIHPGSTAGNAEAKLYAYEAGEKAVQDHLKRIGSSGIAKRDETINGFYQVTYPVKGTPKVNIFIINEKDVHYLKKCINSILEKTTYAHYEIDIIDNGSEDFEILRYYETLKPYENIKVLFYTKENDEKGNPAQLINFGVKQTKGDFIVEFDRHQEILTPNWLEILIGFAQRKEIGCVGGKVYYANGTIKHAGIVYGIGDYAAYLYRETYHGHRVRDKMICNMSIISSMCRMYRREVFEEIQGMNENVAFPLTGEVDFSFRLREKGYLLVYTPQVEIQDRDVFNERERIEEEDIFAYRREIKALKENWQDFFSKPDPYHNINFSPASSSCVVRIDKVF